MLVSAIVEIEPSHFIERCYPIFSKEYNYRNWFVSAKYFHFCEHNIF